MKIWDQDFDIKCDMTAEQRHYFDWLAEKGIHIHRLFNFDKFSPEYDIQRVDDYFATASTGQIILLQFALMVWSHSNDNEFDLVQAVSFLDKKYIEAITEWMLNPFWP